MIDRQPFGRTGHISTRLIFGAAALGSMGQSRADRVMETVLAAGINHIDTAASYGDSELRLTSFLADHRASCFLATKTGSRSGSGARQELELSLQRMGVDHVDLIQLHNLVEQDEWEQAHAPGGAVEALVQAREEGLVRFIGVTGHGVRIPSMHLQSLDRFDFDSVLLPYNYSMMSTFAYCADATALLERCAERNVAVQTIKSIARRRWPADVTDPQYAWYQPLPAGDALTRAVHFVLANQQVFLNTSSDVTLLPALVAAAESFAGAAPSDADLEADATEHDIQPLFDGADLERI
ncbi:MAG: aldo/keto reductase [Ilumatobacteraceae bacterium]